MAKRPSPFVPLFVADRPMSLHTIKGLALQDYPDVSIGIMAHANTTDNFQQALAEYPCDNLVCCAANNNQPCPFQTKTERHRKCDKRRYLLKHTIKMCDSGIFTKEGATLTYEEMFKAYQRMGVKFGVMIDVFRDSKATIEKAKEALEAYKPYEHKKNRFELVVVAQGNDEDEYIHSYKELKKLGFKYIAIGGLLRRREDTVRLAVVRDQVMLFDTLSKLRVEYPDDWLFALGCLHPDRLERFQKLNVWADYKGWIFQYDKKDVTLNQYFSNFKSEHLDGLKGRKYSHLRKTIETALSSHKDLIERHKELTQEIYRERRELRKSLKLLHQALQIQNSEIADQIQSLTTRGLFNKSEEKLVIQGISSLENQTSEEQNLFLKRISKTRELTTHIKENNNQLEGLNASIAKQLSKLLEKGPDLLEETKQLCSEIKELIDMSEHEHRLKQVRNNIANNILEPVRANLDRTARDEAKDF
jgi:hypothetical protein